MESDKYRLLYELQDQVMRLVFSRQLGFYLTGGTALSRFYLHHRYSDDLDFFTHEINSFGDSVRALRWELENQVSSVTPVVDAREFKRFAVRQVDQNLTIDFVADRAPRIGIPENRDGLYVDTVRNILSNKIGTVLSRDEPRDVADIVQICRSFRFSWSSILKEAFDKQHFEREDLTYRLTTFPIETLNDVPYYGGAPGAEETKPLVLAMARDIESAGTNSLAGADAPTL